MSFLSDNEQLGMLAVRVAILKALAGRQIILRPEYCMSADTADECVAVVEARMAIDGVRVSLRDAFA